MNERSNCKHLNCSITEDVPHRYTHIFLDGGYVETAASCEQLPRVFRVACRDCGLDKTYRYDAGVFGPWSRPGWLYDRVEQTKSVRERFERPKRRKKRQL